MCRCEDLRPWGERPGGAIQIALSGKGTSASCLFSLFNLIFKLKLFYSFSYPCWKCMVISFFFLLRACKCALEGRQREQSTAVVAGAWAGVKHCWPVLCLVHLKPIPFLAGTAGGLGSRDDNRQKKCRCHQAWGEPAPASSDRLAMGIAAGRQPGCRGGPLLGQSVTSWCSCAPSFITS